MRADERKGAWVLLILIIAIGIFLWCMGRCTGGGSGKYNSAENNYSIYSLDSLEDSSAHAGDSLNVPIKGEKKTKAQKSHRGKERSDSTGRRSRKSKLKSKSKGKTTKKAKTPRTPMRDILADTINQN